MSVAADQHHHRHHRHGNNAVQDRAPVEGSDRIYRGEIHGDAERDRERDRHVESLGRRHVRLAIALYGHVVRVRLTGAYPPNELFQSPPRAFFTEKLVDAARQSESTASRTVLLPDPFRPLSGATKGVGGKIMEFSFAAKLRP